MTDSAIADTINRHVVRAIADQLDAVDAQIRALPGMNEPPYDETSWQASALAATLMGENPAATDADRAWLVGMLAARTPAVDFDGHPADCDWENLFSHFRTEIEARRNPQAPPARAAIAGLDSVGLQ